MAKEVLKYIVLTLIIAIIIVIILLVALNTRIKTREYNIKTEKINENLKIMLISDLHSTSYGKNQNTLINKINGEKPDAIFLVGDVYDDKRDNSNTRTFLNYIGNKYSCYYVSGNHEYWSYNIAGIKSEIRNYGIDVLEGQGKEISINNQVIQLFGVDDPNCQRSEYGENKDWYKELYSCNNAVNKNKFSILLSHRPERANDYKSCNFDLVLCGHAHGGQVRLPFILNGLYAPNQGFFPKYAGGKYEFDNNIMIVSRGLMITSIPRVFNRPEVVLINIENVTCTPSF